MKRIFIATTLLLAALLASSLASAQGVDPDPTLRDQADPVPADDLEDPLPPEPVDDLGEPDDLDDDDEKHKGFFFRFALGLGWGWLQGEGTLPPAKGLKAVEDPTHNAPLFNLALSLGGGFYGFAIHVGGVYEKMLLRSDSPEIGYTLMGVGGGLTYYFTDYDFYATAQVRFMGLMMFMKGVVCDDYFEDKYEWYKGPGVAFTLGKEWFKEEKERGLGLGLQFNWARLSHDNGVTIDYMSFLVLLTVTKF